MASEGPTYPVGVISFAPAIQAYTVGAETYEALLRQNGVNSSAADRRRRLLDRWLNLGKDTLQREQLIEDTKKELNGPAAV